ncbi:MAG TPA: hypothetical protein VFH66_15630 [Mycobacteriales bacterium]|nr:hypothetical protein [Mycobacteriales bacterium]
MRATTRRVVGIRVTGEPRNHAGSATGGDVVAGGVLGTGRVVVGRTVGRVEVVVPGVLVDGVCVGEAVDVGVPDGSGRVAGPEPLPHAASRATHPIAARAPRPVIGSSAGSRCSA